MRIGLNALQVRAAKSGVGQYIDGLIDGLLAAMAAGDQLIVYVTPFNAENYARSDPRFTLRRFGPRARRAARLVHEFIRLPRQLEADRLDVFHGPANFLPRRCPCPAVVTIHDLSQWVHPERFPWLRRQYWKWMTVRTVRRADAFITVSEASKADMGRFLGIPADRIEVIPEAAHPRYRPLADARFDSAQLEQYSIGGPFILHVGTLEPGKNLTRLVEAFAIFRRATGLDWRLVLAGDKGWLFQDTLRTVERLELNDRVLIPGHVPDSDLPWLYNAAEFFVFPALNEGFGLPPLEALACGAAVIASNRAALPEVLGDAPLYAGPENVAELTTLMIRLAQDSGLRRQLSEKGLRQAAKYSWRETARRTIEVYRGLAG